MPPSVARAALTILAATVFLWDVAAAPDPPAILADWYHSVGGPSPGEDFGQFLSRVAQARLGAPYGERNETGERESLTVELTHFECVSFLESSLAVARCAWRGEPTRSCFVWEVLGFRYRSGILSSYPSRLHYFVDWLEDNQRRWRLDDLTPELGGRPVRREFFYLTSRAGKLPALDSPQVRRSMRSIEAELSSRPHSVLGRDAVPGAMDAVRDGDLIAIVGNKPGRLVTHAGLIARRDGEHARLLHASSHHRRVVVTRHSLADYVERRPERVGVIIARPLPPRSPSRRRK